MKKRAIRVKVSVSNRSSKKNINWFAIIFIILGLILLSGLILLTYTNITGGAITGMQTQDNSQFKALFSSAAKPLYQFWSDWATGEGFNLNLAKLLLLFIITILVYAVLSTVPALEDALFTEEKNILGMLLCLAVGILSTAYLTPKEVFITLLSYNALGITLGIALPFLILFYFSFNIMLKGVTKGSSLEKKIMARLSLYPLWGIFIFYQIYRMLQLFGVVKGSDSISTQITSLGSSFDLVAWLSIGMLLASLVFLIAIPFIIRRVTKTAMATMNQNANNTFTLANQALGNLAGTQAAAAQGPQAGKRRRNL